MQLRVKLIFLANNLFFLVAVLISFQLWLNQRAFPLIPIQENFPKLDTPFDLITIISLIGLLIGSFIYSSRALNYFILFLFLMLILQDQLRWQPWSYHFLLFLIPFCLFNVKEQNKALCYFQIVIIGVYFWSGIHKFNSGFINNIFPIFADGVIGNISKEYFKVGYLIPITEVMIALGLIFEKTRNVAVVFGILMHLSILSWISPVGGNNNIIILPWNLAMITFLEVL